MTTYNTALQLWQQTYNAYAKRPNGGPQLTTRDGFVSDGFRILANFDSQQKGVATLKNAGFKRIGADTYKARGIL
jgi:hypothetical protein